MSAGKRFNRAALLVVDMQDQFCRPGFDRGTPDTQAVADRIVSLLPAFRRAGMAVYPVYYCRYSYAPLSYIDCYGPRPQDQDIVTIKARNSAFADTTLAATLRRHGHRHLYVTGFNINACVRDTALDGVKNGFRVTAIRDLCGNDDYNRRDPREAWTTMKTGGVRFTTAAHLMPFHKS
jgi:nicotinamidase-related amidase